MKRTIILLAALLAAASLRLMAGEARVIVDRNSNDNASPAFKFNRVPPPSKLDAATGATFSIVSGEKDENSGGLDKVHDGRVPNDPDQPAENFFFDADTPGGRVLIDLGSVIAVSQVNSYSWHPGTRGPQVYTLFAADGTAADFNAKPKRGTDPLGCGWIKVMNVDTRQGEGGGGQYGVSISSADAPLGKYRYLLFDISTTENRDAFGNTFYSEIDVVAESAAANADVSTSKPVSAENATPGIEIVEAESGKYKITINTTNTPDLTEWAHKEVAPMAQEWYPAIVKMLPSEGFEAPANLSITFNNMNGVAATSGTRISCGARWFKNNLEGEAVGAIFHELVHVVQQYGRARRTNPNAPRAPGWLTEGIPDYLRWYIYEPQLRGAEVTRRNLTRARYDGQYRPTANFLNWVSEYYNRDLAVKLNDAIRTGKYSTNLWVELTGKTAPELGVLWKQQCEDNIEASESAADPAKVNTLTEAENKAGWKLLFDGKSFDGWHNYKREGVRPGWQVKDSVLVCEDPHNAGDIVTTGKFGAFELQLDYNISEAGNSGIMFHITDEGGAVWATGPEFQLEDNVKAADRQRCGWLYALYQPHVDRKTGKPIDATKPVGEWNHVRLLISPNLCVHEINGVKYFDYVLGSDDFKARVAKSKFSRMPGFAKAESGYIALQGDHGQVSFRNIKVRELDVKAPAS